MAELVLGRLKFHWKGNWSPTTAFIKDDVVKYGPTAWVCTANHTSTNEFDFTKFEQMVQGITWAGEWSAGSYQVNDIVNYGGAIYVCIVDHQSGDSTDTSPNNGDLWERLVGGFEFEDSYNNSTQYQRGDVVKYGGYLYIAKQTTTGNEPTNTTYWDIYAKGFNFVSDWNNSTVYYPGDVVKYGGSNFQCILTTTAGIKPSNGSYFAELTTGFKWRDTWSDAAVSYVAGDVVRYGGISYICILEHSSGLVGPSNPTYWQIFNKGQNWLNTYNNSTDYVVGDLVKYGARVYICTAESTGNLPTNNSYWDVFVDGFQWLGDWSESSIDYKIGDVVRYGGRSYICILGHISVSGFNPSNDTYWELLNKGLDYKGAWSGGTNYKLDDIVEYSSSSYVCIQAHSTSQQPNTSPAFWSVLAFGDSNAVLTATGDLLYRSAGGNPVPLPIGPSGSFLTVNNGLPTWGHLTPQNDYYVSPQGNDANDGRTATSSWKTIKHACEQTFNLGQCRINVSAGTYSEQCPIRVGRSVVLEGNGLGAVTVQPDSTNDNGFGVGISDDGSTPNANSYVFHMNNGARMRNFVFRNFSTGSVLVSLDPGYGPDDTSVWITSQSPYVQNCTSFTPEGTGFKIDGSLHNGGYKSMVANDWTQINSDGIGIHVLNDGRTEIVSCFTYYCNIGYLAESGGKIRGIVGNNSYGEFGAVARGFSQSETPLVGKLRLNNQTINSITQLGSNVHVFTSYRDSVGNRFFVGHTNPTGTDVSSSWSNSSSYPFIAKFNSAGSLDWIYTYESNYGAIHSAVELSDRIYCGGVIYDGSNKGFILSISRSGEIQWQKTVGDTSEIVDVTTDGNNLYGVGIHNTSGMSVIKLNPAGIEQWSRTLEYNDSSASNSLIPTSATFAGTPTTSVDTYALAGDATAEDNLYISAYDTNANQSLVIRINSSGGYVDTYQYGDVRINKLRLDTGNGDGIYLMAAGWYDPAGGVSKNPLLFRLNVLGVVQWQEQLSLSSENGEWNDVLPFGDDVYTVGYFNETTNNNNTGLIGRYTSSGGNSWLYKVDNGTNNIAINGVMLDGVNVIAAGLEQGNSLITNVQRDVAGGIGSITSGSYTFTSVSAISTSNTIVSKSINAIDQTSLALGVSDTSLTLNQTPTQTRTVVGTRPGFAGIGTGVNFSVDELDRAPKPGSVLQIDGDSETYFVIGVNNFQEGDSTNDGNCDIQLDPPIPSNKTPNDQTTLTFREAFSQVRMSGHDFLDIGTGGFADTNYPVIIDADYPQPPNQEREVTSVNGGRVFYVTTDQDGNFRVGDYFKVEQATGRATLSSEEFDLAGLNELQLGSITAGKQGATINEFSTDGTFADNSDTSVPTEKAVKTYVDNQLNALSQSSVSVGTAPNVTKVEATGSGLSSDTVVIDIAGTNSVTIGGQYVTLPRGNTGDRPGMAVPGMIRYNSTLGRVEQYTSDGWIVVDSPPVISGLSVSQLDPSELGASGTTIRITGDRFQSGATVTIGGSACPVITVVDSQTIDVKAPSGLTAQAQYDVIVTNPTGLNVTLANALTIDNAPTWSTAASLGTRAGGTALADSGGNITLVATDADAGSTITYAVTDGALPPGLALAGSTGVISGTPSSVGSLTAYSFEITATSVDSVTGTTATTPRTFSLSIDVAPEATSITLSGNHNRYYNATSNSTSIQRQGSEAGNTRNFVISGTFPAGTYAVTIGGQSCTSVNRATGTSITGVTPASNFSAGLLSVVVTNTTNGGNDTLVDAVAAVRYGAQDFPVNNAGRLLAGDTGDGTTDGVYWIVNAAGNAQFQTYCLQTVESGGWMCMMNIDSTPSGAHNHHYDDTSWWTGTNTSGTASTWYDNFKSQGYYDYEGFSQMMFYQHTGSGSAQARAVYNINSPYNSGYSCQDLLNISPSSGGTTIGSQASQTGSSGANSNANCTPQPYHGDELVDSGGGGWSSSGIGLQVNRTARWNANGRHATRFGTNLSNSSREHTTSGMGGAHWTNSWGAKWSNTPIMGYCSYTYNYGSDATNWTMHPQDNDTVPNHAYYSCTAGTFIVRDCAIFVKA